MSDTTDIPEDDITLAAEYALGLLEPDEASHFAERLRNEPQLRAHLENWESSFAELTQDIAPVKPRARVKKALRRRLFGQAAKPRRGRAFWGFAAGLATALVVLMLLPMERIPPTIAPLVTEIAAEDGAFVLRAGWHPDTGQVIVQRIAGSIPSDRARELWLIAEGAPAPVSLGLLERAETTELVVPQALHGQIAGATLAVSDEPPGGSLTGAPTGDVLAVGQVPQS